MVKSERSQPPNARGNERAIRPVIPIPGPNTVSRSAALIPYTHVGEDGSTTCRRRPRNLTPAGNFEIMTHLSENVRKRSECATQRGEAMAVRMRLRYHTPEGPSGPTEGFSGNAIRPAKIGRTYIELAEIMGNSDARQHLRREMIPQRAARNNPHFMHHWEEYRDAYAFYQHHLRDFSPTDGLCRFPPY